MTSDLLLTGLLVSRLCHDLISPVSAVGNGLELMEEKDAAIAEEAMKLSQQSARRASGRLQFFRLAFGSAGDRAEVALREAEALALGYLDGRKIALEWPGGAAPPGLPPGGVKLLLCLVMLAADALPRGGTVAVELGVANGELRLAVTASGTGAQPPAELAPALAPDADPATLTVANAVGHFAAKLAQRLGGTVRLSGAVADRVTLTASLAAA